jgi:hypothetical protein
MKKTFLLLFLFTASLNAQTIKAIYATQPLSGLKDGEKTEKYKEQKKPILFSYTFSKNKSLQKLIVTQKSSIDTIYIDHFGKKFETTKTNIVPTTEYYYKDFIVNKYKSLNTIDGRN